jgi:hypothetical protein
MSMVATHLRGLGVCCLVAAMAIGCAQVPQQELAEAKLAVDSARAEEAAHYCELDYRRAKTALDSAATLITVQRRRLPFMRSYGQAKKLLVEARKCAERARAAVDEQREKLRVRTVDLLASAETALSATEVLVEEARGQGKDVVSMLSELRDMRERLAAAAAMLEAGAAAQAHDIAASILDKMHAMRNLLPQLPVPGTRLRARRPAAKK